MTREECIIKLGDIEREYQKAKREIEEKHKHDRAVTLNAWAKENADYHVGDIIEANGQAIVVERILGHRYEFGNHIKMYCVYFGSALTKRLQPRKDEWKTSISDDGGREIKLLRKAKED